MPKFNFILPTEQTTIEPDPTFTVDAHPWSMYVVGPGRLKYLENAHTGEKVFLDVDVPEGKYVRLSWEPADNHPDKSRWRFATVTVSGNGVGGDPDLRGEPAPAYNGLADDND